MRQVMAFTTAMAFLLLPGAPRLHAQTTQAFDGNWLTTISCPNAAGALGYCYQFQTQVKDGILSGERLSPSQPGWLRLNGRIQPNGSADIYAKGLIGAPEYAPGQIPKGTDYVYHIAARFEGSRGTGNRVEGRPCSATFVEQ